MDDHPISVARPDRDLPGTTNVDQTAAAARRAARSEALDKTFGLWKDYGVDTDTYLADLRAEWDREWDRDDGTA